jgi:Trk K+ transport system NAD-binding subunit
MNPAFFLVMRRMRAPLIVLCTCYTLAVLGMVLMPGLDDQGRPWRMDFFHAVYFVMYTGSTIGYGEIPYAFSGAQRLWATISIFFTVISWLYAIGVLFSLLQDKALQRVITEARFERTVRKMRQRFYIVCSYGDTGQALVRSFVQYGIRSVVLDTDQDRIELLRLEDYPFFVPGLCADAGRPETLLRAGIKHPQCAGIIALTSKHHINLHIAITSKLQAPALNVICLADVEVVEYNKASFGIDHLIDSFDIFSEHLANAIHSPSQYLLYKWLTGLAGEALEDAIDVPRGLWVIGGYGAFGKAIDSRLEWEGIPTIAIDPKGDPSTPGHRIIKGDSTEAKTLRAAHIEEAVGIVAGTDFDTINLATIKAARVLNPNLFILARQNQHRNQAAYDALNANIVMKSSDVVATRIRGIVAAPLLEEFLEMAMQQDEDWLRDLVDRVSEMTAKTVPEVWKIRIGTKQTLAVNEVLARGEVIRLVQLLTDPRDVTKQLPCIPLLLVREGANKLLPVDESLEEGDNLLICGTPGGVSQLQRTLQNSETLNYLMTGESLPQSIVWRWLHNRFTVDKEHHG